MNSASQNQSFDHCRKSTIMFQHFLYHPLSIYIYTIFFCGPAINPKIIKLQKNSLITANRGYRKLEPDGTDGQTESLHRLKVAQTSDRHLYF